MEVMHQKGMQIHSSSMSPLGRRPQIGGKNADPIDINSG